MAVGATHLQRRAAPVQNLLTCPGMSMGQLLRLNVHSWSASCISNSTAACDAYEPAQRNFTAAEDCCCSSADTYDVSVCLPPAVPQQHQQQHHQQQQDDDDNSFGDGFLDFVQPQQQQQRAAVAPDAPVPSVALSASSSAELSAADSAAEHLRRQNENLQRQLQQQQAENQRLRETQKGWDRAGQQLQPRPVTTAAEPAARAAALPRRSRPNAREVAGSLDFDEPQPQARPLAKARSLPDCGAPVRHSAAQQGRLVHRCIYSPVHRGSRNLTHKEEPGTAVPSAQPAGGCPSCTPLLTIHNRCRPAAAMQIIVQLLPQARRGRCTGGSGPHGERSAPGRHAAPRQPGGSPSGTSSDGGVFASAYQVSAPAAAAQLRSGDRTC